MLESADMESESKHVKHKLEVLDILKEAVTIYVKNINFIIFTFLTSLPFLFAMFYFETLFQETVVDTPQIIENVLLPFYDRLYERFQVWYYIDFYQDSTVKSFSKDYLPVLIQLGFMYLVPLHVLEVCSAIVTVYITSKLRSENNKMSLKKMFQESIDMSIMKGTFITSLYMLALSTGLLLAAAWTVSNCYTFNRYFGCYLFFAVIGFVALAKLLMVYLEWSAIWNMSIVISVLDGILGAGALRVSCFFSSGNQKRGFHLMLVFFVLGLCLRLSCVSLGCYKGGYGIFVQIGLLSVVNTLKWVSCMIYFCDCKEKKMEKKVDVELGKERSST